MTESSNTTKTTRKPVTRKTRFGLALAALALATTACGSGESEAARETSAPAATSTETTPVETESTIQPDANDVDDAVTTTSVVTETGTSDGSCSDAQLGDGVYIVTNIPANDPDGGLVGRAAPGSDQEQLDVLPADYGVFVDGGAESCAVVGSSVWWNVNVGEGLTSWVNASFLARYSDVAEREAIGTTEALCDAYSIVVLSQETDINATAALIALNVELDFHPAGVSGAIFDIVEGNATAESYDAINGYVGPICE